MYMQGVACVFRVSAPRVFLCACFAVRVCFCVRALCMGWPCVLRVCVFCACVCFSVPLFCAQSCVLRARVFCPCVCFARVCFARVCVRAFCASVCVRFPRVCVRVLRECACLFVRLSVFVCALERACLCA